MTELIDYYCQCKDHRCIIITPAHSDCKRPERMFIEITGELRTKTFNGMKDCKWAEVDALFAPLREKFSILPTCNARQFERMCDGPIEDTFMPICTVGHLKGSANCNCHTMLMYEQCPRGLKTKGERE